ncbi:MAG: DUF433 domain-containing protein [Chlamydiae bacterium]|nr:DUF433 domain-containing protein [Chlamydiota bacterium]MBI3265558.1 DUF433 domain-containing protein [Chlamydiota bacterium]
MNPCIEINPRVCSGKPVISGTRIPITVILDQLAEGLSLQALLTKYPELSLEQVTGVLRYCHSVIEHTELEREII